MPATATANVPVSHSANATNNNERSDRLKSAVKKFLAVHENWANDVNRPDPDKAYWDSCDTLFETFESGDLPRECRVLALAVSRLRDEADAFHSRENDQNYYPKNSFWSARDGLEVSLNNVRPAPRLTPLESIKTLDKQNVNHAQICRMYGFVDSDGRPELHKVQKELDVPGSYTGNGWVDPRMAEFNQQMAEFERELDAVDLSRGNDGDGGAADSDDPPCPETPEELFLQGVPVSQSAKMLKMDEVSVQALFDGFRRQHETDQAKQQEADFAAKQEAIKQAAIANAKANGQRKPTAAEVREAMKSGQQ